MQVRMIAGLLALALSACSAPGGAQFRLATPEALARIAEIEAVLKQDRIATVTFADGDRAIGAGFTFNTAKLCFQDLGGHASLCPLYSDVRSVTPGIADGMRARHAIDWEQYLPPPSLAKLDAGMEAGRGKVAAALRASEGRLVFAFQDGAEFAGLMSAATETRFCFRAVAIRQGPGAEWVELDDGHGVIGLDMFCERYRSLADVRAAWPEEVRGVKAPRPVEVGQAPKRTDPQPPAKAWRDAVDARELANYMSLLTAALAKGDPAVTFVLGGGKSVATDIVFKDKKVCFRQVAATNQSGAWLDRRVFEGKEPACMFPWPVDDIVSGDMNISR